MFLFDLRLVKSFGGSGLWSFPQVCFCLCIDWKKRFRRKEKNNEIVENYVVKIHHFLFLHPSLNILTAKTYILEGETLPNFHDSFSQFVFSVLWSSWSSVMMPSQPLMLNHNDLICLHNNVLTIKIWINLFFRFLLSRTVLKISTDRK